jgi:hypothetical protein
MAVSISICNMALGEIRAKPIADIDEQSLEAGTCARYYQHALDTMLELHDWSFANKLVSLALLSDNPRSDEWLYAYALPVDCATPERVLLPIEGDNGSPYYWPFDFPPPAGQWSDFLVENRTLFTNIQDARLEYSSNDIPESSMSALFKEALYLSLAYRIAIPIANDRTLKGDLFKQHELAAQRAVADDRNRNPQREEQGIDEVALVRSQLAVSYLDRVR